MYPAPPQLSTLWDFPRGDRRSSSGAAGGQLFAVAASFFTVLSGSRVASSHPGEAPCVCVKKAGPEKKGFNFFTSLLAVVLLLFPHRTSGEVPALLTLNLRLKLAPVPKSDPVSPRPRHHAFEAVQYPCSSESVLISVNMVYLF